MQLVVRFDHPSSPQLRLQMRVSVFIVTERLPAVVRVEKGLFVGGGKGVHDVFVVRGRRADRRPVHIGLVGRTHCEVIEGLEPGEEIILSSMQDYEHLKRVEIQ